MMKEYKGVLVYGEVAAGRLSSTTCELLGCGRKLADELGQSLACVVASDAPGDSIVEAGTRGADIVYTAELAKDAASSAAHVALAARAVAEAAPAVVLIGHTALGRELGPRLAFRLGVAAATDCIDLRVDPENKTVVMTKPVYGGNALADFVSRAAPQIATVRPKAMSSGEPDPSHKAETVQLAPEPGTEAVKVLERVQEEVAGVKLEDASVVVSGGRGTGGAEPFGTILKELADVLGGAVGASRHPCDNGWAPEAMHIGLTGKIVAPDLYVAVAISGASQHMAGCSGSKTIVAINKDAEANIFVEANYGVVGRFEEVLPAFTAKLRELLAD
jgi:electron transfer flavoprotein alpha subunit